MSSSRIVVRTSEWKRFRDSRVGLGEGRVLKMSIIDLSCCGAGPDGVATSCEISAIAAATENWRIPCVGGRR